MSRRGGFDRLNSGKLNQRGSRSVLVVLLLACATLMTLDYRGGEDSPVEPVRRVVGETLGPVESATSTAVRPFTAIPNFFQRQSSLRDEVAQLEASNAKLREEVATSDFDRNRLAELEGLTKAADDTGYALVPARVIAMGPMQSFSRSVTIDAGTRAGIHADMTVVNNDGLVGRVVRATRTTATVLLVIDADSVVGGRIGASSEIGFVHGPSDVKDTQRLDLELVDDSVTPAKDDVVGTWGSDGGAPYVSGIPIGRVTSVFSSPRETSKRAVIVPFVDFTSLDVVGVVVPPDTDSDRTVIKAEGSSR